MKSLTKNKNAEEKAAEFLFLTRRKLGLNKKNRIILLILFLTLIFYFFFILRGPLAYQKSKTPDLIGKKVEIARKLALENELNLKIIQKEYQEDIPKGRIIRQKPGKGEFVNRKSAIEVAISLGQKPSPNPNIIKVPNIEGQAYHNARDVLISFGLKIQEGYPEDSTVVIQSPQPWERAVKGTIVNVIVNKNKTKEQDQTQKKEEIKTQDVSVKMAPSGTKVIKKGNPNLKRVALTLDDGWNYDPRILDLLEAYGLKITVFVIGGRGVGNENPGFIKRMDQSGFEVCTHSFSHYQLKNFSDDWIRKDIIKGQDVITSVTGKRIYYMRPSGGYIDDRTVNVINGLGYKVILWSADLGDTKSKLTNEERISDVMKNLDNGAIILAHFGGYGTYEALKVLIPAIIDQGYEITTVSRVLEGME